jgi:transposase InsO family protein
VAARPLLTTSSPATPTQCCRGGADPASPPSDHLGPGRLAGICRRARSTVWKVLHRHGLSQRRKGARETYRRYEWSEPGALLHVDVARLARFNRPGHAVTGVRDLTGAEKRAGVGYVYLHCVIDDHSRYAYVEQHPDQGGDTAAAVLGRAIEHFASLGMKAPEAVMSDDAFAYRKSNAFREILENQGARHILTPPYTPRWNGKVERFIQTWRGSGLRPLLAQFRRAHPGPGILPALLQPASPTQLTGRPAVDQSRSQRPWVGQLASIHRFHPAG